MGTFAQQLVITLPGLLEPMQELIIFTGWIFVTMHFFKRQEVGKDLRQNAVGKAKHRSFGVKMVLVLFDNKNIVSMLEEITLTGIFSCCGLTTLIYIVLVI